MHAEAQCSAAMLTILREFQNLLDEVVHIFNLSTEKMRSLKLKNSQHKNSRSMHSAVNLISIIPWEV